MRNIPGKWRYMITFNLSNISLVIEGYECLESVQSSSLHAGSLDFISRYTVFRRKKSVLPHSIWFLVICPFISQLLLLSFLTIDISDLAYFQVPSKPCWKWKSLSHVRLFVTLWTIQSMEFSRPEYWSSPSFLQGIFPTQGSNPGLPHCRRILYHLSHKGNPAEVERKDLNLLLFIETWLWLSRTFLLNHVYVKCYILWYSVNVQSS